MFLVVFVWVFFMSVCLFVLAALLKSYEVFLLYPTDGKQSMPPDAYHQGGGLILDNLETHEYSCGFHNYQ